MARFFRASGLTAMLLLMAIGPAQARIEVDFAKPDVSYSALRVMEAEQGIFEQRCHYSPQKTRSEMDAGGETVVTITRDDLGVIWMMLGTSMYIETSMTDLEAYAENTEGSPDAMEVVEYT